MNNSNIGSLKPNKKTKRTLDIVNQGLARRYRAERRFRYYGLSAIVASLLFLSFLFISIFTNGYSAFMQTFIQLNVFFDPEVLNQESLATANYQGMVKSSLRNMVPDVKGRREKRKLYGLVSSGASFQLRDMVLNNPDVIGKTIDVWLPADDDVDMLLKGHFDRNLAEGERRLNDKQLAWIDQLSADGRIEKRINKTFFSAGDSREPELAGIWGAVVGSFLTLAVTLMLSFPIGVAAAIYLEEFAPKNRWTDLIEVNINNLAAVPSIVFGLLGLAVFLNFFGLPRSAPMVGGLVLSLMTLPTIIIASRSAQRLQPEITSTLWVLRRFIRSQPLWPNSLVSPLHTRPPKLNPPVPAAVSSFFVPGWGSNIRISPTPHARSRNPSMSVVLPTVSRRLSK